MGLIVKAFALKALRFGDRGHARQPPQSLPFQMFTEDISGNVECGRTPWEGPRLRPLLEKMLPAAF